MKQTLNDYGCRFTKILLLCDNESAIKLANKPISHSRTKHIDIHHHFLRDHETKGDIIIHHVSTEKQLADIFTKPLDESRFYALRSELIYFTLITWFEIVHASVCCFMFQLVRLAKFS